MEKQNMELCEILTHIYGHNQWYNPFRTSWCSIGGIKQTPYEAYKDLNETSQRIVVSLFGRTPNREDGLNDESCPVDYNN